MTALVLAGAAALLAVVSLATARRPAVPLPDRCEYLRRWAPLHGGYRPDGRAFTGRWLKLVFTMARPLAARGASPDALTAGGVLASASAATVAAAGGRWPLLAAAVVIAAGMLDNLDGAVAILTDRTTRWGAVLDSLADRLSDVAYLVPLWILGAPGPLCVLGGAVTGLQEYARSRAGNAGMREIGVVTIWERPSRVILTVMVLLGCGLVPRRADVIALAGSVGWAGLGAVGLTQLLVVVRRVLRG